MLFEASKLRENQVKGPFTQVVTGREVASLEVESISDLGEDLISRSNTPDSVASQATTVALSPQNLRGEIGLSLDNEKVQGALNDFVTLHLLEAKEGESPESRLERTRAFLLDPERAKAGKKPRMEFRSITPDNPRLLANIAMSFADGKVRDANFQSFRERNPNLSIVSAGSTTLEIGNKGVDKATIIHYVAGHLENIAEQSGYKPGALIDAMETRSFLCLDGDGTLWGKPVTGEDPEANHLGNSEAQRPILNYLRAGGILVINSGNDPQRTVNRLVKGIPPEEREELLPRVFIGAAGGHALLTLNADGTAKVVPGYQKNGLSEQEEARREADFIYIGDDAKRTGNDYAGYKAATETNAICVTDGSSVDDFSSDIIVKGETRGVEEVVTQVMNKAKLHPGAPLFSDTPSLRSSARQMPAAKKLMQETLERMPRAQVNERIAFSEGVVNAPVRYEAEQINTLIQNFHEIRQQHTLETDPAKKGGKETIAFNFDGLLVIDGKIRAKLDNPEDFVLRGNFKAGDNSFEDLMEASLDKMNLQNGDVVRILEPGNNDQATPMFVAKQVAYIQAYAEKKGITVNTEVLVMGKGGHATTATFAQFAEVRGDKSFSGTEEAISLGATLEEALKERGIDREYVEDFSTDHQGVVQIKRAKESTNTGENVDEASIAYNKGEKKPRHVFVSSAVSSSTRQAQTFAQQYSDNRNDPLLEKKYDSITAIPLPRTERFVAEALTDHQAVTEMYAGLAERARLYAYAFNPDGSFIPAAPIDREDLEDLYKTYDQLSGANNLEASKQKSMKEVLAFFQSKFTTMETSISWSKQKDLQLPATRSGMQEMANRYTKKERVRQSLSLYRELKKTNPEVPAVKAYGKLLAQATAATLTDRQKEASLTLMAGMVTQLERIAR